VSQEGGQVEWCGKDSKEGRKAVVQRTILHCID
jgi:hypothetical protein